MDREARKRLETLNRGPLQAGVPERGTLEDIRRRIRTSANPPGTPTPVVAQPIVYGRTPPVGASPAVPYRAPQPRLALDEAVSEIETPVPPYGYAFLIQTSVSDLHVDMAARIAAFCTALTTPERGARQRLDHSFPDLAVAPRDLLFVDLETTGLGGTPLFLIGTMVCEGHDLIVRQYLARSYAEEPAVTALFLERAARKRLLVSYNGKSFDMPYVRTRAAANGLPYTLELPHFDLLHEARRIWKDSLPNCKLQTLEHHICGRPPRAGDIAGCEIPEAYHAFVRTGNAAQLAQILTHNLWDLITMAEIITKLPPR